MDNNERKVFWDSLSVTEGIDKSKVSCAREAGIKHIYQATIDENDELNNKELVVVFDLGGTLMEFKGMSPVWIDYYKTGFENVNKALKLNLTEEEINQSVEILKSYNPRVNYREIEVAPTEIFTNAISEWTVDVDVDDVINCFFEGINSNAVIYDYAFDMINDFKSNGYKVACLTDLPNGMPDDVFKKTIQNLIDELDLYVSSQSCGYRKPNKFGLVYIANYFNIDVKDLLFIGDEEKDKLAANNAGCEFKFIGDLL